MPRTFSIVSHRREWKFPMADDARHLFTSDTHYDHGNIILYSSRPFLNDQEMEWRKNKEKFKPCGDSIRRMNNTLVDRINEVVRPQDILWHLGDVAWHGKRMCAEFLGRVRCKNVILIWGNHDEWDFADLIPMQMACPELHGKKFGEPEAVRPCYDQCYANVDGQWIHLSHYPGDSWESSHKGMWHLYGHVHGNKNRRTEGNPQWSYSVDAGVDSHGFYPWTMDQLRALFAKRQADFKGWRDKLKDKEDGGMTPIGQLS